MLASDAFFSVIKFQNENPLKRFRVSEAENIFISHQRRERARCKNCKHYRVISVISIREFQVIQPFLRDVI